MLANVLDFKERKTSGVITALDQDMLRKTLELLHKDDKAIQRYFGFGRQALLKDCQNLSVSANKENDFKVGAVEQKITLVVSLSFGCDVDRDESFGNFYARWYSYFKYVFLHDSKYSSVCEWISVEGFLPSVRPHITALVKGLSDKSLVHQLNSRIAEDADFDLETFNRELADEALVPFLTSYPLLTHLLLERIEDTVAYLYKVIEHFVADIDRLEAAYPLVGKRIDSIDLGLGDSHGNGETVCRVQVSGYSLVYKPRSNREAVFYNALLAQLQCSSGNACFTVYSPIMVSLENRCWIENVENLVCENENDLVLFFQRLGAQVAVIHALNGIDFHYENIIACGSSPVMIDLECLFTPVMVDLRVNLPHSRALFKTIKLNSQSVFSSGFVPYSPDSDNDYSGLSRQKQFVGRKKQLVREQGFYRLKQVEVDNRPIIRHLPIFEGETRSVADYKDAFLLGFERGYDEMVNCRNAVLELLTQHAGALKSRVLIKNTQRYADFIAMMLHPRFTQCRVQQELLMATLWSELSETLNDYEIPRHEIIDLEKANFPCFTLPLLSNHLLNAHGQTVASLAIERPFDSCHRKLDSLSLIDKAFQIHILQMCLFPVANEDLPLNRAHQLKAVPHLSRAHYLQGAIRIAEVIEKWRIEGDEGDVGWTFMDTHPRTRRNFISPMGSGLYSGMGGLAIFYLSLFRVSGAAHYRDEAEKILCAMVKSHGHFANELTVGAYFGLTSYLYVLVNYQLMTGRKTYQTTVDELLHKLEVFPREGDEFDFIHGWCGTVTVLVNLYQIEKRETLRHLIEKFSLAIQSAFTLENGTLLLKATGKPLWTGFSHGISGALLAMGKVWEVTRDPLLAKLIAQWLQAENRLTVNGFWVDLRETAKSISTIKWCHGDAGILIARDWLVQVMGEAFDDDTKAALARDIERCERHLWDQGLGSGYSLCHGDFGNLLCLLKFYRETRNEEGIARVKQALSQVAHNFFNEDFLDERNVPDLGLMLGISGVGLALLNTVDDSLPDVLSMEFARPITVA
ncbi:type 2 lanthipeptide synthetase LanM [Pseudomonas sp. PD9R]|uniref:type 2 lanthipeptide synthetase LanM n=1 Tax=Pseudomonas sp. PD9R TaxID=2853534 RepID=UPI001C45F330|nr:type 2 lanthipeptide synthetase LanM [Pseudomonas sp. PD9R]MBV6824187.1 type 2 lantipeptide synthetase LanM [Pseudomonas sp. PD9R]